MRQRKLGGLGRKNNVKGKLRHRAQKSLNTGDSHAGLVGEGLGNPVMEPNIYEPAKVRSLPRKSCPTLHSSLVPWRGRGLKGEQALGTM